MVAIFGEMGFLVAEGPHIEDDFHNFTALNIPPEHPARQMHDTFYLPPAPDGTPRVLRTHTSPVQVRTMTEHEAADPRHRARPHLPRRLRRDPFADVPSDRRAGDRRAHPYGPPEGLPDRVLPRLLRGRRSAGALPPVASSRSPSRRRKSISAARARAASSPSARGGDWLEILGCGMVHPKVLANCGIDPARYQGFAFGMGIERIAMLKYGIPDLRTFYESDLRWLRHYGFAAARRAEPARRAGAMKFTLSWLKDHLDTQASVAELAERLTMLGLEVEGVEDRARDLAPFTVGYVVEASKHPERRQAAALPRRYRQGHRAGRVRRAQRAHRHEGRVRRRPARTSPAPASSSRGRDPRRGFQRHAVLRARDGPVATSMPASSSCPTTRRSARRSRRSWASTIR